MSVWPQTASTGASLIGSEGALVSVAIHVSPRFLESLLEALAELDFPVNPQIYHDAAIVYEYGDGRERTEATTIVEFPAYAGRLTKLRTALEAYGFDPESVTVTGMLDELHSEGPAEPAPPGADYRRRRLCKSAGLTRGGTLQ
jgi:hypothetical protein